MVADTNATLRRIYDGALMALARRGVQKLTMSDICSASGVARGTLYRYFRSKDDVLTAISQHVKQGLLDALATAVEEQPAVEDRVAVLVTTLLTYADTHPEAGQVIAAEPAFSMEFVRGVFPQFVAAAEELMAPALESAPAVQAGSVTVSQLSELILRTAATAYFIPSADIAELARAIANMPGLAPEPATAG